MFVGGALAVQVWHYYESYGRKGADKVRIQFIVGVVILLSLLQDCALVHRIFAIHVLHFGDFAFPLLTGECPFPIIPSPEITEYHCAMDTSRLGDCLQLCLHQHHEWACADVLCPSSLGGLSKSEWNEVLLLAQLTNFFPMAPVQVLSR